MGRRPAALLLLSLFVMAIPAASGAASLKFPPTGGNSLPGVYPTQTPEGGSSPSGLLGGRLRRAPAVGETVWVYRDSLNTRSSPSNEDGWTHRDDSAKPIEWHRDTFLGCQGTSWWCGHIDSSWVFDSNRAGYDNNWTQVLLNVVDLQNPAPGTQVKIGFRHYFNAEPNYDFGQVEVNDIIDDWTPLALFTGQVPNGGGCDTFTVTVPESIWARSKPLRFRFKFTSDTGFSSADGLYDGDGWVIDNVTVKAGATVKFFDDMESGPGTWQVTTLPGVGDYFFLRSNIPTEDVCTTNTSKVWTDYDPITFSFVPRLDNLVVTPPVFVNRASDVFTAFDVYRNLPLQACFFYHLNFRYRDVGMPQWSHWIDPTNFVYYGANKDWLRQTIPLPGAGGHDSVQVELGFRDYSDDFCDGVSGNGAFSLFDNVAVGVIGTAPPSFIVRDIDLFNDTYKTTPFFADDNFNTPLGDSAVVQVDASKGYKEGFMFYRLNSGSFTSVPLQRVAPAIPTHFLADVAPGSYPANTTLQYYFSATDSTNQTSYYPPDVITAHNYLSASILPLKYPTNITMGCVDSSASILFVNHFSGRETTPQIANVLTAFGFKYDTWDVNAPSSGIGNCLGGSNTVENQYRWPATDVGSLLQYSTIIWHAGNLTSFTISPEDQATIQSWIQQPGKSRNFWITGDDVGNELISLNQNFNNFLAFTCGVNLLKNNWESAPRDTLHPLVVGVTGSPSFGRSMHVNGDCPIINDFDAVTLSSYATQPSARSGVYLKYPNGLTAATRYATRYVSFGTDSARVVFQGFSFNLIEEGAERLQLLKSIVQTYFKENPCYIATAVEEDPTTGAPAIPNWLAQNSPNPFNPETVIRYSVSKAGPVSIRIYNIGGALVRTLVERPHGPGVYSVRWNGTDDSGGRLGSGVYFYSIEAAGGYRDSKKLILLK